MNVEQINAGLNPYYSGSYSLIVLEGRQTPMLKSLNPYYSGSYSLIFSGMYDG